MGKLLDNGYTKSLAKFIFEGLIKIQSSPANQRMRPRLSGSGFLFNTKDIEKIIIKKNHLQENETVWNYLTGYINKLVFSNR